MPSADLWEQFPVIGIIMLFMVAIGFGLRVIFREITAWQDTQDKKRDDERQKQRDWEAAQERAAEQERRARDLNWQSFFEKLNQQNREAINGNSEALEQLIGVNRELISKFEAIYNKLVEHDKRAEAGFSRAADELNRLKGHNTVRTGKGS